MKYPTMNEVETANITDLCRWHRFLKSPGYSAAGLDGFESVLIREKKIIDRVNVRMKDLGGMTPEISKKIGW